jgi:hypothetical protein
MIFFAGKHSRLFASMLRTIETQCCACQVCHSIRLARPLVDAIEYTVTLGMYARSGTLVPAPVCRCQEHFILSRLSSPTCRSCGAIHTGMASGRDCVLRRGQRHRFVTVCVRTVLQPRARAQTPVSSCFGRAAGKQTLTSCWTQDQIRYGSFGTYWAA